MPTAVPCALLCRSAAVVASFRCSRCAAVLLLHLLALLLAIVVTVVVNLSAVCTSDVAVIVIVTVMYPQWMLPVDCWLMVGCYMVAAGCCLSRSDLHCCAGFLF